MRAIVLIAAGGLLALAALAAETPGALVFHSRDALIEGGGKARYEDGPGQQNIGVWDVTNTVVRWTNAVIPRGTYRVLLTYSCGNGEQGSTFEMTVGSQRATGVTAATGGWKQFVELDLGPVLIRRPERVDVTFRVTRIAKKWGINIRSIRLAPEP